MTGTRGIKDGETRNWIEAQGEEEDDWGVTI